MGLHVQYVRYRYTTGDYIYSKCNKGTGTRDYIYIGMKGNRYETKSGELDVAAVVKYM
jgi:hypothetical protein